MDIFLLKVCEHLYDKYKENFGQLCIVFPNKRAGLFFNKYLSQLIEKPVWSPTYFTINELFQSLSKFQLTDNILLINKLFQVYKEVKKSLETFDEFYFWGEMLLNDFDDIDKYLIDAADLFQNIKTIKNIEKQFSYLTEEQLEAIKSFWNAFDLIRYSKQQEDFISVWNVLFEIYKNLKTILFSEAIAYEGMICRDVVEKITNNTAIDLKYEKYIFIGFNALNSCENQLFTYLKNNNKAEFYWDYDELYTSNEIYEAGLFIRKNIKNYPSTGFQFNFNNLKNKSKDIRIISVANNADQAKTVKDFLYQLKDKSVEINENTGIILADEHLLIPVLNSIPESIENLNVTMGYSIKESPVYAFFEYLLNLQSNSKKIGDNKIVFYYEDVINILNHQFVKHLNPEEIDLIIAKIKKTNRVYINLVELPRFDFLSQIFSLQVSINDFSIYLLNIFYQVSVFLNSQNIKSSITIQSELVYNIYLTIKRVNEVLLNVGDQLKIPTYIKLLKKIIRNLRVPFTGEPLSGLQILGILETRNLDFENVIILSMNEGIFPKTNIGSSFIPFNLRKGFGLPTIQNQDAIYAYYFYRLIQRAKNITLVYNTKTEGITTGEMSRFLYQLKYDPDFNLEEIKYHHNIQLIHIKAITIQKTDEIINKLKDNFLRKNTYMSPSSINNYIDCSLRFYFRYVAGIKEPDEVSEELEMQDFGNILHAVMHKLYKVYLNINLNKEIIRDIRKNQKLIDQAINEAFNIEFFKTEKTQDNLIAGRNLIVSEIIRKYVYKILENDEENAPFKLLFLEKLFSCEIPIQNQSGLLSIKLGGKIDRVDEINAQVRIVDYKTGQVKNRFTSIKDLFDQGKFNRNSSILQVLLYSFIFSESTDNNNIIPKLVFIRKLFNSDNDNSIQIRNNKLYSNLEFYNIKDQFKKNLQSIVAEIFNPQIPFKQAQDERLCRNCPYISICQRDTTI